MVLDASKYLNSYGWKGKGHALGENGLTKPIAVTKKQDTHGLGQDRNESFAWWDNIFNKAAKGVKIEKDGKDIAVTQTETGPTRNGMGIISYHKPKELQKMQFYSNFVESSASVTRSPSPSSEEVDSPKKRKRDESEALKQKMGKQKKSKDGKKGKKSKRSKEDSDDEDESTSAPTIKGKDKSGKSKSRKADSSKVDSVDEPKSRKKSKKDKTSASSDTKESASQKKRKHKADDTA